MQIGDRLRSFRAARLWTQPDLSRESGVSIWLISQTELGNHVPGILSQEKLARAFAVPRDVLFPPSLLTEEPATRAAVG